MRIESNELLPPTLWSLPMTGRRLDDRSSFDRIGNLQGAGGRASSVSSYTNDRLNQITSRSVPPYVDVLGVDNPMANVTVRVSGGTTYTAARKEEYCVAQKYGGSRVCSPLAKPNRPWRRLRRMTVGRYLHTVCTSTSSPASWTRPGMGIDRPRFRGRP